MSIGVGAVALISSTVLITLHTVHRSENDLAPSSPPKNFLDFTGSQFKARLKTEQINGAVHLRLEVTDVGQDPESFKQLLESKVREHIEVQVSLQDAGGFSLCGEEFSGDKIAGHVNSDGRAMLEINDTIDCQPDLYARVQRWTYRSNIVAALRLLPKLTTNQ